jgi:RHS repeat-associated protein
MTLVTPTTGAPTTTTYDANGNMTEQNAGRTPTTFTWDGENRLIVRADPTNGILTSTYDANSRRAQLATPSATTIYVRDGQNVLLETNALGITQAHYTDWPGVWGGLVSQSRLGASSFYGFDLSSNTRLLTNISAAEVATYLTDAFGVELSVTGSVTNFLRFGAQDGYWRDVPSAYAAGRRVLLALLGRWASRDMLGQTAGVNVYEYVDSGPVSQTDASGQGCLYCGPGGQQAVGWRCANRVGGCCLCCQNIDGNCYPASPATAATDCPPSSSCGETPWYTDYIRALGTGLRLSGGRTRQPVLHKLLRKHHICTACHIRLAA